MFADNETLYACGATIDIYNNNNVYTVFYISLVLSNLQKQGHF